MNCGQCAIWFKEDFESACPVFKTQLNNINNKILSLKKRDMSKKSVGVTLYSEGVGINSEACKKYVERN